MTILVLVLVVFSSGTVTTDVVSISPSPVQSKKSRYFGNPSLVVCNPAAARSQPVSKIATFTPRPSAFGFCFQRSKTLVSSFGILRLIVNALSVDVAAAKTILLLALVLTAALAVVVESL